MMSNTLKDAATDAIEAMSGLVHDARDQIEHLSLPTARRRSNRSWWAVGVVAVVVLAVAGVVLGRRRSRPSDRVSTVVDHAKGRAKDDLHLTVPQRFFTHSQSSQGDRHVYAARTRFIPAVLLQLFDCMAWPVVAAVPNRKQGASGVRLDVGARILLRHEWQSAQVIQRDLCTTLAGVDAHDNAVSLYAYRDGRFVRLSGSLATGRLPARIIAADALKAKGDLEALAKAPYGGGKASVADHLKEMIGSIGENMTLRRSAYLTVKNGVVALIDFSREAGDV